MHGGIAGYNDSTEFEHLYNAGEILANANTITYLGGLVGWEVKNAGNTVALYNIGTISLNGSYRGGYTGWCNEGVGAWTHYAYLQDIRGLYANGNSTSTAGMSTSDQIKEMAISGGLAGPFFYTSSSINNGYPYLRTFYNNTDIWVTNSSINDGQPYLKAIPPQ